MKYKIQTDAPAVPGLIADILPNAAYGNQLILREGTVAILIPISEIVTFISRLEKEKEHAESKYQGTVPVSEDLSELVNEVAEEPSEA